MNRIQVEMERAAKLLWEIEAHAEAVNRNKKLSDNCNYRRAAVKNISPSGYLTKRTDGKCIVASATEPQPGR